MGLFDTLRSVMRFRGLEGDRITRRLQRAPSINDLRAIARRRMPRGVFDYIDGAAEDERAMRANAEGFAKLTFRPRVLRNVGSIDPSTTLLGRPLPFPLAFAPTGFGRIADPQGELAVARAAARADIPYSLSTLGTRSIEEIAAVSEGRKWFQVYVWRDRGLVKDMIDRAKAADYEALMLTVDLPVHGMRERDVRNGFTLPPKLGINTLLDGIKHPAWTWSFLRAEPIKFANVVGRNADADGTTAVALGEYMATQMDPSLTWGDVEWMRSVWDGPIVIKGIQTVEDAVLAADAGVQAIAISNHGGRQLDSAPVPIELVAPIADAVGDRVEIICDGGVRRGSDIVKALCLGARACMVGRAYLYGLGAAGERGVDHVLKVLHADVLRTMALIGATSVGELSRSYVT
jgi:L-lactate dehydrogenase (cytochrome)